MLLLLVQLVIQPPLHRLQASMAHSPLFFFWIHAYCPLSLMLNQGHYILYKAPNVFSPLPPRPLTCHIHEYVSLNPPTNKAVRELVTRHFCSRSPNRGYLLWRGSLSCRYFCATTRHTSNDGRFLIHCINTLLSVIGRYGTEGFLIASKLSEKKSWAEAKLAVWRYWPL